MNNYSVVIPAYNAAETISESIQSILEQTLPPNEIIVVDDGSKDETVRLAANASEIVRVISQENHGCGHASSVGARAIQTLILAFLDADDLWLPEKMARQLSILNDRPDVDMVFGRMRQFRHGGDDKTSGKSRPGPGRSTLTMRHKVFLSVGDIIDPPGRFGDMVDWIARFRESGYVEHNIDDVLALRRIIPSSMTYTRDSASDKGYLEVAFRAMQRRRQRQETSQND